MKTLLTLLFSLSVLASCTPTPNEPDRPENKMIHDPQSQVLTAATPNRTVKSTLVCGCGFILRIDGQGGDTAIIQYRIPTAGDTLTAHDIAVTANTAGLTSGTYTSWIALSTPDVFKGALRDTIYDTLIVP